MENKVITYPGGGISGIAEVGVAVALGLIGWGLAKALSQSSVKVDAKELPDVSVNGVNVSSGQKKKT